MIPNATSRHASIADERRQGLEASLSHDMETVRKALRARFGPRVAAIALGGSFGRGEGCAWRRGERWVPANNLNFFIIADAPIDERDLLEVTREILAESLVESVVLTTYVRSDLPHLPLTLESFDLTHSPKLIEGDAAALAVAPRYDGHQFPLREAEKLLRRRLVTLLEAFPREGESFRSRYQAAKSIFASVDAFLIRDSAYTASYREKVARLRERVVDAELVGLVEHALQVKLGDEGDADRSTAWLWESALRLHLDSMLGLLRAPGRARAARLLHLLGSYHFQTTSWVHTLRNLLRIFLHRNRRNAVERLLLAVAIDRDAEGPRIDLPYEARRVGLSLAGVDDWESTLSVALDRWYSLPRLPYSPGD